MARLFPVLFAVFGLGLLLGPVATPAAHADESAEVDVTVFYEALAPHGEWIFLRPYGWVWSPSEVDFDWRPYLVGRWVWVEALGWTWMSEEPFGWAVYHYGRWLYSPEHGWVWVPGGVWAPAWVEFRVGPGWIGWTPLPPPTQWRFDVFDVSVSVETHPWVWTFVPARQFAETTVVTHVVAPVRTPSLLRLARRIVRPTATRERVTMMELPRVEVETSRGSAVPTRRLREARAPTEVAAPKAEADAVVVYRPRIRSTATPAEPPRRAQRTDAQGWMRRRQEMLQRYLQQQERAIEQPPAEGAPPADADELAKQQEEARRTLEEERKRLEGLIDRRRRALEQPPPAPDRPAPTPDPREQPPADQPMPPKDPPKGPRDEPKPPRPQPKPKPPAQPPSPPQPPVPPQQPPAPPQPPERPDDKGQGDKDQGKGEDKDKDKGEDQGKEEEEKKKAEEAEAERKRQEEEAKKKEKEKEGKKDK
jgi:hypothetical protein